FWDGQFAGISLGTIYVENKSMNNFINGNNVNRINNPFNNAFGSYLDLGLNGLQLSNLELEVLGASELGRTYSKYAINIPKTAQITGTLYNVGEMGYYTYGAYYFEGEERQEAQQEV